jgi:hypothetical protein
MMAEFGDLKGIVKNNQGETMPFVEIAVLEGEVIVTSVNTDVEGKYFIKNIAIGVYTVKAEALGYVTKESLGVHINLDQITFLDFTLQSQPSS